MTDFDDAPFLFYSVNENGKIEQVSQGWLDMLGYNRDEVLDQKFTKFLTQDSSVYSEKIVFPALWKDGYYKNVHYKFLSKSNTVFDFLLHGIVNNDNKKRRSFEFMIDITDRIEVERELRMYKDELEILILERTEQLQEMTEMYKLLSRVSPVGIMRLDDKGRCTYINQAWRDFTNMTQEKASGYGWFDAVHPKDRKKIEKQWHSFIKERKEFSLEYRLLDPDGDELWVLNQVRPVNGVGSGYVATFTNITTRKKVLPQLIELKQYKCRSS